MQQKKNESRVIESPDSMDVLNYRFSWDDGDNHPFGYYKGKFHYGDKGTTHYDMMENDGFKEQPGSWRRQMTYPGRIWINAKLFSLWQYPTTVSGWKKLIADLSNKTGKDILNVFSVELAKGLHKGDTFDAYKRREERVIKLKDLIDRLEGKGKKIKIQQHSTDTQNLQHIKSPVQKKQQQVPMGIGSKKRPAGMSLSQ